MTEREKAAADAALAALPTGTLRPLLMQAVVTDVEIDEEAGTWSVAFDITHLGPADATRDADLPAVGSFHG